MAYLGQFDNLIRETDRGRAIRHTRTVAVFSDGLVVCAVSVYGAGKPAGPWRRSRRPERSAGDPGSGGNEVRVTAKSLGDAASAHALAEVWPRAAMIPFDAVEAIVLTRPQQVTRLTVREEAATGAGPVESVFLGDMSAEHARNLLGPLLGDRLKIEIPES